MSESKFRELERQGKKKAKIGELEDGPSSFRSPWYLCDGIGHIPDGGIENFGESGEDVELDPLVVFGSGIMTMILSKLDARSVALARLVSREWLRVASSDKIWAPKKFIVLGKDVLPTMRDRLPANSLTFVCVYAIQMEIRR